MTMIAVWGLDNYDDLTELTTLESEWTLFNSGTGGSKFSFSTTTGRFGGGAIRFHTATLNTGGGGANIALLSAQPKTIIVSTSLFRFTAVTIRDTSVFLILRDGGSEHVRLNNNDVTNLIEVFLLGVNVGTFPLSQNVWHRIEVKLTVDNAAGELTIKLDDSEVFTTTGVDTQVGSNAFTDTIRIQAVGIRDAANFSFDDIVINDDQGSLNNDFLGDLKIETLRPTAAGDATDFTPSTGANWENVDDLTGPDGDSTFNESSVAGHQDLYTTADLSGSPNVIHAVVLRATARKDDAGARSVNLLTKTGTTIDVGATQTLLTSFVSVTEIHEVDPDTSVAWTASDVNGMQIGIENV